MTEIFSGKPARPQSVPHDVVGSERWPDKANFAGHYAVIEGPNAPDYMQVIIVDTLTGQVFQPPLAGKGGQYASNFSVPMDPLNFGGVKYRLDSKLLILPRSCPDRHVGCSAYYFVWQGGGWSEVSSG